MDKLIKLRTKLDFAKSETVTTGIYKDPVWYNNLKYAIRMTGKEHQFAQNELAKRNKARRRERHDSVERRFVEISRRRLQPEVWQEIMEEATMESDDESD